MTENEKRFREIVAKYSDRNMPNYWQYSFHVFLDDGKYFLKKEMVEWFYFGYTDDNGEYLEWEFWKLENLLDPVPKEVCNILPDGRTVYQFLKDIDFNVNLDFESSKKWN